MVVRLDPVGVLGRVQPGSRTSVRWTAWPVSTQVAATARSVVRSGRTRVGCVRTRRRRGGYRVYISSLPSSGSSTSDTTTGSRLVFGAQPVLAPRCRL